MVLEPNQQVGRKVRFPMEPGRGLLDRVIAISILQVLGSIIEEESELFFVNTKLVNTKLEIERLIRLRLM